jgi:hypothetical protein
MSRSIERLETEIPGLGADKRMLQEQFDDLQGRMSESAAWEFKAILSQRSFRDCEMPLVL